MPIWGDDLPSGVVVPTWPEVIRRASDYGLKDAVVSPSARLSYQSMVSEVFRAQRALTAMGVHSGDRLVVLLGNDWPYLSCYWAALASGVKSSPIAKAHSIDGTRTSAA